MGASFSEPLPTSVDTAGHFCVVLRSYDKVRLVHAPKEVEEAVTKVVTEVSREQELVCAEDKFGSSQFRLPGSPFSANAGRESSVVGKLFAVRAFEELNALGYDLLVSSDLSRDFDQSSWFFRKSPSASTRPRQPVLCLAPASSDRLILLRGCDYVVSAVRDALSEVWSPGVQWEKTDEVANEKQVEFKLRGRPWEGEALESTLSRKLILELVGKLGSLHWRFLAATNLTGDTDSFFFIFDPDHVTSPVDLAMLSLNRSDRIRLINFNPELIQAVRNTILNFYQTKEPETRNYYGAYEYKVKGYPFSSTGGEAVAARQLICRLLEAYRDQGWACSAAVDISRKSTDKSVFIFRRMESAGVKVACLALSDVDRIRLLNFPPSVSAALAAAVGRAYLPGVAGESAVDASRLELDLCGAPWTQSSSFSLHARSMLCRLLAEASKRGWRLLASADVSAQYIHQEGNGYGNDYPMDVHSLFFVHQGLFQPEEEPTKAKKAKSANRKKSAAAANGFSRSPATSGGGFSRPVTATSTNYAELRVSDLEGSILPSFASD